MNLNTPTQQPDNLECSVVRSQQEQIIYNFSRHLESTDEVLLLQITNSKKLREFQLRVMMYLAISPDAVIEIGCKRINGEVIYCVKDKGAGFDMKFANKLFTVFKRMRGTDEFECIGVGLTTVQRIISHHGGRMWAEVK